MSVNEKVAEYIYRGKVLNRNGEWVDIVDCLKAEKETIKHLERGEVYVNNRWRAIDIAIDMEKEDPSLGDDIDSGDTVSIIT